MKSRPILLKLSKVLGLLLAFIFILSSSFWLSLSGDKLEGWLEYRLNKVIAHPYNLEIKNVTTCLFCLEIERLTLSQNQEKIKLVVIEDIQISLNPLWLLIGQGIGIQAECLGGRVDARLKGYDFSTFSFKGKDIKLNRIPSLRKLNLIRSQPTLEFKGDFQIQTPYQGHGEIEINKLTLKGTLPKSKNKVMLITKLPETKLEKIQGNFDLNASKLTGKLTLKGDLSGRIQGNAKLKYRNLKNSMLKLDLKINLSKAFERRIAAFMPLIQGYKTPQGTISLKIQGQAKLPRITKN